MNKPLITWRTRDGRTLNIPLDTALYRVWRLMTYPLQVYVGYFLLGVEGAAFAAVLMILNFRGEL